MAEDEKEPTWDDYLKTYLEPIKKEISELKQIADSQVTINEFYHKEINALEKKVDDLFERYDNRFIDIETIIGLNFKSEVEVIRPFRGRINALEKKVDAIEKRYETKRDAVFKIGDLQVQIDEKQNKEISELKESHELSKDYNTHKRYKIKEVLRELFKKREEYHDNSIHQNFYTGLLKKLDAKDGDSKPILYEYMTPFQKNQWKKEAEPTMETILQGTETPEKTIGMLDGSTLSKCKECDAYNLDHASECEDMYNGVALRCEKEPTLNPWSCSKCGIIYRNGETECICGEKEPPEAGSGSERESIDRQTEETPSFTCVKCGSHVYLSSVGVLKGKYMCAECNKWQDDYILVEKADLEDVENWANKLFHKNHILMKFLEKYLGADKNGL